MIIAWKDGVKNEFSERSWEILVDKNGWEQEAPFEKSIPIEVEKFIKNDYSDLTYMELKALCKEKGISFKGNLGINKLIEKLNASTEQ